MSTSMVRRLDVQLAHKNRDQLIIMLARTMRRLDAAKEARGQQAVHAVTDGCACPGRKRRRQAHGASLLILERGCANTAGHTSTEAHFGTLAYGLASLFLFIAFRNGGRAHTWPC